MNDNSPFFKNHIKDHVYDKQLGIINNDYFLKYINHLINSNTFFSTYLLDVDNLKKINDNFGRIIGDQVLNDLVKILKSETKDIGYLFRIEGDKLAIIIENIVNYDEVWAFSRKLLQSIRTNSYPYLDNKNIYPITVTCAVSRFPLDAHSQNEIIDNLNTAIFRGKKKGKNCFIIYNKSLHKNISITEDKNELNAVGLVNYIFFQFKYNDNELALSNCAHMLGNYLNVKRVSILSNTAIETLYSENSYESDTKKELDYKLSFTFDELEIIKLIYISKLDFNLDKNLNSFMKRRGDRSLLVYKLDDSNKDINNYLLIESEIERIYSNDEMIYFQIISNLYSKNQENVEQ